MNLEDQLILVDGEDLEVGILGKERCHDGDGVLHRAFSVFLFDPSNRVLIQQRAAGKRLWPGFWSNSVCSHPRVGEETVDAAFRRVHQELGIEASVHWVYRFEYHEHFEDRGAEHELCSVFVGRLSDETIGRLAPEPAEIAATEWLSADDLAERLSTTPERFTPWFKLEWQELTTTHADTVRSLLDN